MRGRRIALAAALLGCGETGSTPADGASTGDAATSTAPATSTSTPTSMATTQASTGPGGSSTGAPWVPPDGFEPFACADASPDVTTDRLCEEDPADEIDIECTLEGSCPPGPVPAGKDAIVVMAYNIERGLEIDGQLQLFADGTLPMADVILVSEADRGCARTSARNIAWDYAEALGMYHVFGVEFVELPRPGGDITAPCEHGNAILSRYPIGNVRLHRHETNLSWFDHEAQPRLGGRMAILADIAVGDQLVHVQVLHFESGINDGDIRAAQAAELAALGTSQPYPPIIGGDTNAGLYILDLENGTMNEETVNAFFTAGYADTHAALPVEERRTHASGLIFDILFVQDQMVSDPVVCGAVCSPLSDHRPVWATISI